MTMQSYSLALFFILSSQTFAQVAVADWFPLHPGDRWVYEHETRDEDGSGAAQLRTQRWRTEETITNSWSIPEGTLFKRRIQVTEGTPGTGYREMSDQMYLVRGNCLYRSPLSFTQPDHQLTRTFREDLLAGRLAADFCFPLTVGMTWGAPHWGNWRKPADAKDWKVVEVLQEQFSLASQTSFHIASVSAYLGSGETGSIWFTKGVGIVSEEYIHHGTLGEVRTRLIRFEPAPQQ